MSNDEPTHPVNVFIVGADDANRRILESMPRTEHVRFHDLFQEGDMRTEGMAKFDELLERADRRLREFDGTVDAVIGYWDFPASSLVPILTSRFGLPGATRDSMLKCEHKYWSRLLQREVVPDACPAFCEVDPFDANAVDAIDVPFPFWIKPVKSTSSFLSFRIENRDELDRALEEIRDGIDAMANAFDELMDHVDLPPEVRDVTGRHCLVEQDVSGRQCTVSGYVYCHEVVIYGIVDSINLPGTSSFQRYQLPSTLPQGIRERMMAYSTNIMRHIGFNDEPFNIEYFYDEMTGEIHLLEINPRMSQSHGHIYDYVDGEPNHRILLDLALGLEPEHESGAGPCGVAAKWFVKRFEPGRVERAPTKDEIRSIEEDFPHVAVEVLVSEGEDLRDLDLQDAYSYELACIHVGAESSEALEDKVERILDRLRFEISNPDEA